MLDPDVRALPTTPLLRSTIPPVKAMTSDSQLCHSTITLSTTSVLTLITSQAAGIPLRSPPPLALTSATATTTLVAPGNQAKRKRKRARQSNVSTTIARSWVTEKLANTTGVLKKNMSGVLSVPAIQGPADFRKKERTANSLATQGRKRLHKRATKTGVTSPPTRPGTLCSATSRSVV
jgi:hypothetical protein